MRVAPLFLALAVPVASAQEWVEVGAPPPLLPSGQECEARTVTPTAAGLVVTTPCGPYRLEAGDWVRLGEAAPSEIDAAADGTLYGLRPGEEAFRYDDALDAWVSIQDGLAVPPEGYGFSLYSLTPSSGGVLWITARFYAPIGGGSGGGLYRSDSRGATWTLQDPTAFPQSIRSELADGALSGFTVSCYLDPPCSVATYLGHPGSWTVGGPADAVAEQWGWAHGGQTAWAPSPQSPAYVMDFGDTLLRSVDGAVWEPTGFDEGRVVDLLSLQQGLLVATDQTLHRSTDGGLSWSSLVPPFDEGGEIADLALGPDGTVYAVATPILDGSLAVYRTAEPLAAEAAAAPSARALRIGPNPSAGGATVFYQTASAGPVHLAVFDVTGRRVAVLQDGVQPAGAYEAALPALPAGLYVVHLASTDGVATGRAVVVN